MTILLESLLFAVGLNLAMFMPAYLLKTDKLTDISYSVTFIALAIIGLLRYGTANGALILGLMVILWGVRLGSFLFWRINKTGKDNRFDKMRSKFASFLGFWLLQGITVPLVLIPVSLAFTNQATELGWLGLLGIVIWAKGLTIEAIADWQKAKFKQNPANRGKWIASGLWHYSRHPNYFGEILVWIGVYITAFNMLSGAEKIIGLASPLYIGGLLIFVSGIPLLEKVADKRWGNSPTYQHYKQSTPLLVPRLPRLK